MPLTPNASILKAGSDIIAVAKYFGRKTTSKTIKSAGIKLIDYSWDKTIYCNDFMKFSSLFRNNKNLNQK
jgi:hypothetical protein